MRAFAAGTVSSFLWLGDSHGSLAITWIGLLAWFGSDSRSALQKTRSAPFSSLNWQLSSALVGALLAIALPLAWWFSDARLIDRLADGAGEASPVLSSEFEVYREGNRLVYVKDPCGEEDVAPWFFLHVYPVDEADPYCRRQSGKFDNLDFRFERYGPGGYPLRGGGRCAAVRVLPHYGIARIATGAHVPGMPPIWRGSLSFEAAPP